MRVLVCSSAQGLGADFEQDLIERSVKQQGRVLEPSPEGKVIDEVLVVSEEILGDTDPWPSILNFFHARTRADVVRREVLLSPGEPWQRERVAEIERNLRRMVIFAVTRVVAVQAPAGHVALMVVTKDRWSLRINSEFNLVGTVLQYLRLRPAEMNFLGRNIQASLDFLLRLDTLEVGQYLLFPRLFGQKVRLAEAADLVLNRQTLAVEGSIGYVLIDRPFYSLDQRWSFSTYVEWNSRRQRVFRGETVWQLDYPSAESPVSTVPFTYQLRDVRTEGSVTRRFGQAVLLDVSAGVFGYDIETAAAPGLSAEQAQWLKLNYLPRTETAAGLTAKARLFEARFVVLKNIETLELSEDYQLGALLQLGARWALPWGGGFTGYLEANASARYRWYVAGNLLSVEAAVKARFSSNGEVSNRRYVFEVSHHSRPLEGGRLVTRVLADFRQNDLNNTQQFLGGANGLRGASAQELVGRNSVLGSVEYRTRSFEIATVYVSPTLFYDVGSAFNDVPVFTHSAGLGLRILLPQFNQEVLKINFGLVINSISPSGSQPVTSEPTPAGLAPDFINNPP